MSNNQAFRWTAETGMVGLGFVSGVGGSLEAAFAANADGSIIVVGDPLIWDAVHGCEA